MPDNKRIIYKMFTYYLLCSPFKFRIKKLKKEKKSKWEQNNNINGNYTLQFLFFWDFEKNNTLLESMNPMEVE